MHAATFTAVVVLPTPPFWFAIAYTVPIGEPRYRRGRSDGCGGSGPNHRRWTPSGGCQWPFAGHSRTTGKTCRSIHNLRVHVEMALFGPRKGLDPPDLALLEPQLGRRGGRIRLLRGIPGPFPRGERPAHGQQRR